LLDLIQKLFHSFPFHLRDGYTIYSGAPTVSAYFFPCPPQNVRPEDAVI
jgi:hypothetical protein